MSTDDIVRRRQDRLREELRDAGVRLDLDCTTSRQTLDEISYARFPRRHEGKLSTYGAFVVADDVDVHGLGGVVIDGDGLAVDTLRLMADGRRSYLVVGEERTDLVVFPTAYERETDIVHLLDSARDAKAVDSAMIVVQRLPDGFVRILGLDGLVIWDGTRWRNKPYARAFVTQILRAVPGSPRPTLEAIVAFCVHDIGPAPTGTILVWDLGSRRRPDPLGHIHHRQPRLRLPALSLIDAFSHSVVRSLVGQIDGAVLLDRDATLVEAGVRLTFSERADAHIAADIGVGTRHASARRFSFDEPDTVVFVVSEDGPLTVYASGEPIARLDNLYSDAQSHLNPHTQDEEAADEPHDRQARRATRH